jgi:hypothetical protein
MAKPRGEHIRNVHRRIAPTQATQAALTALPVDTESRVNGAVTFVGDYSVWFFDFASTAVASATVLVPDDAPTTGRFHNLVPAGGAVAGNSYKTPVHLATSGALAAYTRVADVITANANGAIGNFDGVAVVLNGRYFLNSTGTASDVDNGIYVATDLGSGATPWIFTRSDDCNVSGELVGGSLIPVQAGTNDGGEIYLITNTTAITINTTAITHTLVPSLQDLASTAAGLGAALVGTQDAGGHFATATVEGNLQEAGATDSSIEVRLSNEECARSDTDSSLGSVETRLSAEECARSDTDSSVGSIETRLSAEECARSDTDSSVGSIETRLSAEECARSDTDSSVGSIETRLSAEECARSDTDSSVDSIETRLSAEECARSDTDSSVGSIETRLSAEECSRSDTDSSVDSIQTRLSAEECARSDTDSSVDSIETRLSAEECARSDTDSSVGSIETRLSAEECARSDTDSSVGSIETRVSVEESTRTLTEFKLLATATITSADLTTAGVGPETENIGAAMNDTAVPLAYRLSLADAFDNGAGVSLDVTLGWSGVVNRYMTSFDAYTGSALEGVGWHQGTPNVETQLGTPADSNQIVATQQSDCSYVYSRR